MLVVNDVTKAFGDYIAVDGLSIRVNAGTVCGFLGPNGAGKTTTMRMIAGIIAPTKGEVLVNGLSVATHPVDTKRVVGYVPDRPYLYEKLTAFEYLEFVSGLYGLDVNVAQADASAWATFTSSP